MKTNNFFKILTLVVLTLVIQSCTTEQEEKNQIEDLSNIDFSDMKLNIDFSETFLIEVKESKSSFKSAINNKNIEIYNKFLETFQGQEFAYNVVIKGKKMTVTYIDNSNLRDPGDFNPAWDCPSGSSQVGDTCWSPQCVKDNIASALAEFSSGDTVTLTIHHGGAFGGVKVCVSYS